MISFSERIVSSFSEESSRITGIALCSSDESFLQEYKKMKARMTDTGIYFMDKNLEGQDTEYHTGLW